MVREVAMNAAITFVALAERYLAERRALGFGLRIAGQRLLAFARFADAGGSRIPLTEAVVVAWARNATRSSPLTWGRRLEIVRPFAAWLRQHDPHTEVPRGGLFGKARRRLPPHVYAEVEVLAILREAARLVPTDGLRPASVATLLGLLACTGMRVSEALALRRGDVDLGDSLVTVRLTKFRKSRLVPLHPSAVRALRRYAALRDLGAPGSESAAFFVIDGGVPLTYSKVRTAFRRIRIRLGWEHGHDGQPRVHDLRHTFACRRLLRWHEERVDVDSRILDLSTYLGHAKASDTYWYLSAFPELMTLAARRFESFAFSEVRT
jgi:integrase